MNGVDGLTTGTVLHGTCAVAYLLLSALILVQVRKSRTGVFLSIASAITAAWAGGNALAGWGVPPEVLGALDLSRSLAWYAFVLHLYRRSITSDNILSRTFGTMGLVGVLMLVLLALLALSSSSGGTTLEFVETAARLGIAVCAVLLIENLWLNTAPASRWHINVACIALGALFVYDIVLSADAVLTRSTSPTLYAGRALASLLLVPLLAIGAARNRNWRIDLHISRTAAFHSATLVASGVFFLSLAAAGEVFRQFGADWGGVVEIGLIFAGVLVVGVLVTSGSARSWLRSTVVDHFFSHRYDYRREWVRCIATLSMVDDYTPLHTRAIRAIAEIVDSPAGLLFLSDGPEKAFVWSGSMNMGAVSQPVMPDHPLIAGFRDAQETVVLDQWQGAALPDGIADAWLVVPLAQGDRWIGFVVLNAPRAEFRLDREVFELLKAVSRMVASYIAEQRMTEILTQTRQLSEYGKRFSFVAHDIKNVSSQLSMLLANAEVHMQNPEFQRDMLATVRSSVQKIGTLLRRLQEPERDLAQNVIAPAERIEGLVEAHRSGRAAEIVVEDDGLSGGVAMSAASFDAVITHILTNALEASEHGGLVRLRVKHDGRKVIVDVVDRGHGMTPEFIRDQLFRPFGTSKQGGTGIGAFQARELLRQAGGDLLVMSERGRGTTMRVLLPLVGNVSVEKASRVA